MFMTDVRGKVTTACAGMVGYDAEATVEETTGNVKYVHASCYGDDICFSVTDKSLFDYLTGQEKEDPHAEILEDYEGINNTSDSKYHRVFVILANVLKLMEENL